MDVDCELAFSAPRGTYDLLPPESEVFLAVRAAMAAPLRRAGYGYVETPTFEQTALFERGVGESTDVVSKEMYSFTTRGGDNLSLKPEGTAGVVRAVVQHKLYAGQLPVKLWYSGSYYRYERPQAGRYRHFSQVGAEALGVDDPALDAEIVSLGAQVFRDLGLTQVRLLLNSLGDAECRPVYRARLVEFLSGLDLDEETRRRIEINPLRVLDDKRPEVAAQVADAPLMSDSLCDACRDHYDKVRAYLRTSASTGKKRPAWSAGSTTTRGRRSSSSTTGSARSPRSAVAVATTGCRSRWAGRRCQASDGRSVSTARSWRCGQKESSRPRTSHCEVFGVPLVTPQRPSW